jgi:transposase
MDGNMVTSPASEARQDVWADWQREHAEVMRRATGPQRILLEAAVRFLAFIAAQPVLLRMAAFFLLHSGMGLTPTQVGAALGRTNRAMRTVKGLGVRGMLDSVWAELGRHRQPKLHPEHAGPIAKFLVEHPDCTQPEVAQFVAAELSIVVDAQTIGRFLEIYGLTILRPCRTDGEADVSPPP